MQGVGAREGERMKIFPESLILLSTQKTSKTERSEDYHRDSWDLTHLIQHGFIVTPQAGSSRTWCPTLGILKPLRCAPLGPHSITVKGFVCHHFSSVDDTNSVLESSSQVNRVHPYPMQHPLTLERLHQQNAQLQPWAPRSIWDLHFAGSVSASLLFLGEPIRQMQQKHFMWCIH